MSFQWQEITVVVRFTVDPSNCHTSSYQMIDSRFGSQEYCESRYNNFERAAAVPLQRTPHLLDFLGENSGLVNDLAGLLAPAFLSVSQYRQFLAESLKRAGPPSCLNNMFCRVSSGTVFNDS
jgi:hypothetical protein